MKNVADYEELPVSRHRDPRVAAIGQVGRFRRPREHGASGRGCAGADGARGRAAAGEAVVGTKVDALRAGDEDRSPELEENDKEKRRESRAP